MTTSVRLFPHSRKRILEANRVNRLLLFVLLLLMGGLFVLLLRQVRFWESLIPNQWPS